MRSVSVCVRERVILVLAEVVVGRRDWEYKHMNTCVVGVDCGGRHDFKFEGCWNSG